MAEWMRRVVLTQVGPSLLAAGAVLIGLSCGGEDITAPTTGSLEITTATSGPEPDADGYTVTIDGGAGTGIASNGILRRENLESGSHSVRLAGMAANCGVEGDNPRSVTVTAGGTAITSFSLSCGATPPPTGTIEVTTATTGSQPDSYGYTVSLDGGAAHPIEANATITISAVGPGPHSVQLSGLAANCSAQTENPRQVTVTPGQQASVNFVVECLPVPGYRRIDLGTLGGRDSRAYAINSEGVIVGEAEAISPTPPSPLWYAFVWQDGRMRGLEGPPDFDNSLNSARAINSKRQVTGFIQSEGDEAYAFLWNGDLKINLGALGCRDDHSYAYGINDAGLVVGMTWVCDENGPGPANAFVWDGRQMISLTPGEYSSAAHAINSADQIVGSRGTGDGIHAFLWGPAGVIDLGTLGGSFSVAHAINAAGQITGSSRTPGTESGGGPGHAFLWENGVMTDLGTLGGDYSVAYGINAARQVVGTSNRTAGGPPRAFLWENGVMKDLGAMAGDSSSAHGINDAGQVVGWSATSDGGVHATLWTPQ